MQVDVIHGNADFGQTQQLMVVLGIAKGDGVAARQPKRIERRVQSCTSPRAIVPS
jgi:hypothetical protein